ncbi:hypothetical protein BDV23DRAFT_186319 [Aspergillus alliaceus]|uniref:Dienelactone hydrolase domain-containing protein n=1 Tax=Petromyces alliaceus TaxID=209559 RepID=A0A5N7BZZ3_PETAA|nr:hypothetical protein BDV23DRAFT_186319 [Aspergillus alliaceus]
MTPKTGPFATRPSAEDLSTPSNYKYKGHPSRPINLAGRPFKPSATTTSKTSALIVIHPGGGVKERTARLYARKLATNGFTTFCYDASYQGESGGSPHFLEDPNERLSDIYAVTGYLQNLDTIDSDKIGVVGI